MNVFIRFGQWLERRDVQSQIKALDVRLCSLVSEMAQLNERLKAVDEVKERLGKLEIFTGVRKALHAGKDPKTVMEFWNQH